MSEKESEAVDRLTAGIEELAHRETIIRCLSGDLSPTAALRQLSEMIGNPAVVRAIVDEVTRRAASISRATDSLLRDRVDELTQLMVEEEQG